MLSFIPRGVLDEILNLIESVSEGFSSYSHLATKFNEFSKRISISISQRGKLVVYLVGFFCSGFSVLHFCESLCLFNLRFNFDFYVSKIMHL